MGINAGRIAAVLLLFLVAAASADSNMSTPAPGSGFNPSGANMTPFDPSLLNQNMTPIPDGALVTDVPVPTARPDTGGGDAPAASSGTKKKQPASGDTGGSQASNPCETNYNKYLESCQADINTTENKCDEKNSEDLAKASAGAQQAGQGDTQSMQYACAQSGNVSTAVKNAMTAYRTGCSGALNTCRSSCAEFVEYVQKNPTCFKGSGSGVAALSLAAAKSNAEDAASKCEPYQSKVDDADSSIASYGATGAASAACQQAAQGTSSDAEAKETNAQKAYCELNPTALGCSAVAQVDCKDPGQAASNKVCVCSTNPNDPMCLSAKNTSDQTSANSGMIDSSSRVAAASGDDGLGDLGKVPPISHAPRGSGGADDTVDGRQGSASPVGDAGGGSGGGGAGVKSAKASGSGDSTTAAGAGANIYGGSGGGSSSGKSSSISSGGGGYGGASGRPTLSGTAAATTEQGPDLRQFLPGGARDPAAQRGLGGHSPKAGVDGITGPYSSNWKKMQFRFQELTPTLIP